MDGLSMIAASTKLQPPAWVPLGHREMATCGIWPLQVANAGPTASTVLAPLTPQSSVVGPQTPLPVREKYFHHDPANQESAGSGTTHSVHF